MFDFDSFRISGSSEAKKPALFKTADEYEYDVHPCASLFAGKHSSGKSIYLPYAVSCWQNGEEAFGLVPSAEIHPVCFAFNRRDIIRDKDIEYMNPFKRGKLLSKDFSQFIQELCERHSYNVIFIDNLCTISSKLPGTPKQEALFGDFFSGLSSKLGIYFFVVMNSSKSTDAIIGSYYGACHIAATTRTHIDLSFDWHTQNIEQRVMFGKGLNELIPETKEAFAQRLEEKHYEKYGGYEQLHELLSLFAGGHITVRIAKVSFCGIPQNKVYQMMLQAKEDGYLYQIISKKSYALSAKGHEFLAHDAEWAGCVGDLIYSSDFEKFRLFLNEQEGIAPSSVTVDTKIKKSTFELWRLITSEGYMST